MGAICCHKGICRFFRLPRADNSVVSGDILPNFKLLQSFINVLNTCKYEEDRVKNEGARVANFVPLYKSMGIFQDALGQLTPQFLIGSNGLESIRGFFGFRLSENSKFHILCSLHSYHKGNMP